jgi:hypothetical protein
MNIYNSSQHQPQLNIIIEIFQNIEKKNYLKLLLLQIIRLCVYLRETKKLTKNKT